jgi:hypothetical protein
MNKAINNFDIFVETNKEGIAFILGVKPWDISANDIKLMCNYLVPETHRRAGNTDVIDPDFVNKIKSLTPNQKGEIILFKAMESMERRSVFGKRVPNALKSGVSFSPKVEAALEAHRKASSRTSFRRLADNFNGLKRNMVDLKSLLDGPESFNESKFRFKINMLLKKLQNDLRRCDYHARAGMTWAIKSGVDVNDASNAINQIYLRHMQQIEYSFKIVDQLLQSQGIRSTMSNRAARSNERWANDIAEAKEIVASQKTGDVNNASSQSLGF